MLDFVNRYRRHTSEAQIYDHFAVILLLPKLASGSLGEMLRALCQRKFVCLSEIVIPIRTIEFHAGQRSDDETFVYWRQWSRRPTSTVIFLHCVTSFEGSETRSMPRVVGSK